MKKKYLNICLLLALGISGQSCSDFLLKEPLGKETEANYFNDPANAVLAVNGIYDVLGWEEGPGFNNSGVTSNLEWMYGDVMSDDAEKGSTINDFQALQELKDWTATSVNDIAKGLWSNAFAGIYRSNNVLKNIETANISSSLKTRLTGEATFLRAYFYFYLARVYGGVPLFTEPVKASEYTITKRATLGETLKFIESDLKNAVILLPERGDYSIVDLGRATKGAANAYLARVAMYAIGTDNSVTKNTWQEVYDLTRIIMASGQYSLTPNYAEIHEAEGENNLESIFEIQEVESSNSWGAIKTGTTSNIFQNNRSTWGWGFNNPSVSLVSEFETGDPRRACTVYSKDNVLLGTKVEDILYPSGNMTNYLNRKAAILKPSEGKESGQNIRKMRYADVLLMNAEAAANIGKEDEARQILNQIRARAKNSTTPKGSKEGSPTSYEAANIPNTTLPAITTSVTGKALMEAIWHERRVEFGMEALRLWDLIRTGRYLNSISAVRKSAATRHAINSNVVNPVPVLPIPLNEVQSWGLDQNPGY
ncbi:RagB/SusD family nutrient uptake outer membrane protein [Lacihabitans soyangensis]|uniref:RagB/SusD family nutrient uptake outer membrane protein n=1 Tax=Lacihabitans soyangensis TaxID=869394 RepID=A0AAE3KUL5_9BACT|nr:RagB/SusD family nutrient uptake outer membrane protein [Lacihabitans soyangensis]MCP9765682.1 RagB/SusD family nutrient uptake outer membrane protein [Lacihabitans soyangensis]